MSEHLTRLTILEYVEEADYIDRAFVEAHLAVCAGCREVLHELHSLILLLEDGSIFRHVEDADALAREHEEILATLEAEDVRAEREAAAADAFVARLAQQPVETWERVVGEHPDACTSALVQRLVDTATPALDRQPERALVILRSAEVVAFALDDVESRRSLGDVFKQRANALRMLGRYEQAVDDSIMAEKFYASLATPDASFDVGQARYTLATVLFKMTRYDAALQALARARTALEEYGTTAPLAKTLMLDALVRIEQGDVAAARETLLALLPIEERLAQPLEAARVQANLAECNLRLGKLDAAMENAVAAAAAFRALGNTAEETRAEWTKAMIRLAGSDEGALDRLYEVAAVYREHGMVGEAGFVKLDIAEELLRRGEWAEAELVARDLVTLFMAAGVTLASVDAIDFLRRAVENRSATAAVVHYIRSYLSADDAAAPFEPPTSAPS